MKKTLFISAMALFVLGACGTKNTDSHEGHNHETESHEGHNHGAESHEGHNHEAGEHEGHNHETEGHDHEAERHEGHNHESHNHGAEAAHGGTNEIVLPADKAKAVGVEVSEIKPVTFRQVIRTSGQILAAQGSESVVVATVSGVVSWKGKVTEGMAVSKGATVVTLSSKNIAEGDPVQKARIAYETAKKEYERMKALLPNQIVSQKEFAQAEQAYENARIAYEAVAKGHSNGGQAVIAPIAGFVKNILVNEGDYVQVGQPLLSITQNRRLQLRADVSEKYYGALSAVQSANFVTPYNNKVYELSELNGRLLSYGKSSKGSYLPVTFEFDNRGEVVPGSFVEIYLLSTEMPGTLTLPRTALTEEQGSFFVYRQLDAECYEKQLVTTGADNGREVQILSGIHAGDKIVTRGAYQVKLASATNAIPGHSHEH